MGSAARHPAPGQRGAAPCLLDYCRHVLNAAWIVRLQSSAASAAVAELRAQLDAAGLRDCGEPQAADDLRAADVVVVWR